MLKKILLSSSLFTLFAGCGGTAPDTVWEVSSLDGTRPTSCNVAGTDPAMVTTETGIQTNVGPWGLYEGPAGKMYLVLSDNKTVIEGTKGDTYSFQYTINETDKEPFPMRTTTHNTVNTVNFKISGDTMDGTWEVKDTYSCSGTDCKDAVPPDCTVTNTLKGRRLEVDRYKVY